MIKYISSETLLYYNEEFHRIIHRVIDGLHNAIHIDHMIENPEKDRSDERLVSAFERGLDIGYTAPFLIKILMFYAQFHQMCFNSLKMLLHMSSQMTMMHYM